MTPSPWDDLDRALDAGPPVRFWLRDDDAAAVTPPLRRLADLCADHGALLLMAVIPSTAEDGLGLWTAENRHVTPCQHGYAHRNHAEAGQRACELGGNRDDATILAELRRGWQAMDAIFGVAWAPILVPPWNRIRDTLPPALPALGFRGLSTFAGSPPRPPEAPPTLDCDLDIIDWRHGRVGRDAGVLCGRLVGLVAEARATGQPIGVLTHHLAHDAACWSFLEGLLPRLARHQGARFVGAPAVLGLAGF